MRLNDNNTFIGINPPYQLSVIHSSKLIYPREIYQRGVERKRVELIARKKFYPLSKDCVCHNMKLTTLMDVYNCVCGQGGEEIKLDENVRVKAKACIDTMLTLGE